MHNLATTDGVETPEMTLGEWLRKAREDARLYQEELADRINVSQRTISNWERNVGCPDIRQYRAIAEVTGARWLLDLSGQNWKRLKIVPAAYQPELPFPAERPALAVVR